MNSYIHTHRHTYSGGDLAPSLGGTAKIFPSQNFWNDEFFREKCPFSHPKFLIFFLSHRPDFSDFPFFTVIKCPIRPFYTGKTTISEKNSLIRQLFYSVHPFEHIQQHYFSKYWREPMHGSSPPPQILGGPSPQVSAPAYLLVYTYVHTYIHT